LGMQLASGQPSGQVVWHATSFTCGMHPTGTREKKVFFILTIVLIIALLGSLPRWPHSREWGYYPSGGISLVLLILVILFLMGRL
jgi:hypothetical protein